METNKDLANYASEATLAFERCAAKVNGIRAYFESLEEIWNATRKEDKQ